MNGADDLADGDPGGGPAAVPVGWQRQVEAGAVRYISPSGTSLSSLEQMRAYLLSNGTCKCGLECPLDMHKVFNFDPAAVVVPQGGARARGDQDMTKLCNHRRKTAAMATLYRSMESATMPLGLPRLDPGAVLSRTCHLGAASCQLGRATGLDAEGPSEPLPPVKVPERRAEPCLARPGSRLASPRPGQASSFPHHHSALLGDVFPGRGPSLSPTSSAHAGRPACPLQRFGLEPLDMAHRPFPPLDELLPGTPPPEGAPTWTGRACPLPAGTSLGRPATASAMSPGGRAELSPQRSGPSSMSSEPRAPSAAARPPPGAPQPCKEEAPPSNALANQSSSNLPVPEGKGLPGLLGLPLGQLLQQQPGTPSYPASSLLSAAAKAQLASQRHGHEPPSSTLPGHVLLSVVGGRALPKPPRRQRRSPTVRHLLKDSEPGQAQPAPARWARPREPPAPPPPGEAKDSPLGPSQLLLGTQAPSLPLGNSPPGLLPACPDVNSPLLSLFSQLASASAEPASGSPPQPRAPSTSPGAAASPVAGRAAPGPGSGAGEGSAGGLGPEPFPFLEQEQVLPPSLLQGSCLGSVPFALALSQPQLLGCPGEPLPGLGLPGDPEGQVLQGLLMASLLQGQPPAPLLPLAGLGLGLPSLDLLPALLPLPELPCQGDKAPEPFAALPDEPLLLPPLPSSPALLALNSALLAASLAAPDAQPGVASPPMAPTSTSTTATTTEPPAAFGSALAPPSSSGRLPTLLPPLASPLLSAALLGDPAAPSPLLQSPPQLLPPALPLTGSSPLAWLLQLSPGFGASEKLPAAPSDGPSPNPPSALEPEPLAPFAPAAALPSALDSPAAAGPAALDTGSSCPRTPLKRARRSGEGLNGNMPGRGPPRRTKSARRGAGRGRGAWGSRRHFNGQAGEPAAPTKHPPHPAWRCNGEFPGPAGPPAPSKAEEPKGEPGRLRPSRRGRRRKGSTSRPSTRPETPRARGPSAEPSPAEAGAPGRRPRPGRPAKNRPPKLGT
ncbi:methyl-CpG-binding domain protein 6 [Carettochelys insculpta]|uniref:methyl-CpG-binding domain protein 6 n=1 Tax=Carettochelys insculpta TaxID=44489 RepID=UPI003EB7A801